MTYYIQYHGPVRRGMLQCIEKNLNIRALRKYLYVRALICHRSGNPVILADPADKRSEANALNYAVYSYVVCEH